MANHATLESLLADWRQSMRCMEVARSVLDPALAGLLKAGPCQSGLWVLLAEHGHAAAKARHCLPRVLEALQGAGMGVTEVQVRVARFRTGPAHAAPVVPDTQR